jgi:hypothetical protein
VACLTEAAAVCCGYCPYDDPIQQQESRDTRQSSNVVVHQQRQQHFRNIGFQEHRLSGTRFSEWLLGTRAIDGNLTGVSGVTTHVAMMQHSLQPIKTSESAGNFHILAADF